MPLSALAEVILQPVFEVVLRVAGYVTGYLAVPVLTLGRVLVEPDPRREIVLLKGGTVKRRSDGVFIMDAELAALCGLAVWVLVGVAVCVCRSYA